MITINTKRQAHNYIAAVARARDAQPCVYGHYGCALEEGGPCENEVAAQFDLLEEGAQ